MFEYTSNLVYSLKISIIWSLYPPHLGVTLIITLTVPIYYMLCVYKASATKVTDFHTHIKSTQFDFDLTRGWWCKMTVIMETEITEIITPKIDQFIVYSVHNFSRCSWKIFKNKDSSPGCNGQVKEVEVIPTFNSSLIKTSWKLICMLILAWCESNIHCCQDW